MTLEQRIIAKQGELAELQAEYRRSATVDRIDRAGGWAAPPAEPWADQRPNSTRRENDSVPRLVRLQPFAVEEILAAPLYEYREVGGLLTGRMLGDEILVDRAYPARRGDPVGDYGRIAFGDSDWFVDVDEFGKHSDIRLVGCWHTHPCGGEVRPSAQDEKAALRMATGLRQNIVDVILGPGFEQHFQRPEWTAWLTVLADRTTRPADLILEENYTW